MKVNTLGSCVIRDSFRFCEGKHCVDVSIQRNPISTMMTPSLNIDLSELEEFDILPYEKRMFFCNLNKTAIEKLLTSDAEWLLLDISEERYSKCEAVIDVKGEKQNKRDE